MKRAPIRLPDFAGVALVDILANGVAMLIIVIVLSIASRIEREERTAAQVEEVATVMSRRFSTSLVLNSLAASPPAQLHDYQNSPLDQLRDPQLLPIFELHKNFVRELYSGAVWSRAELLREPNAMDAWLANFSEVQKLRVRADVYDIAQFYLALSILREHGVTVRHWHFLAGGLGRAAAGHCPPGVSAQDCDARAGGDGAGGGGDGSGDALSEWARGGGDGDEFADGDGDGSAWPPHGAGGDGAGGGGDAGAPFPGGASLGGDGLLGGAGTGEEGAAGTPGSASFPSARAGAAPRGLLGAPGRGGAGGAAQGLNALFRLSSPDSLRLDKEGLFGLSVADPTTEQVLAVLFQYVSELQATLDAGASPSAQLENFNAFLRRAFSAPPELDDDAREVLRALATEFEWSAWDPNDARTLEVNEVTRAVGEGAAFLLEPNRRLERVTVARPDAENARDVSERNDAADRMAVDGDRRQRRRASPELRLNAHPGVWRGLTLTLEHSGALLMPLHPRDPQAFRWRALAYVAPGFDDFIVGFAYAAVSDDGRITLQAEGNRARIFGSALRTAHTPARFGARAWLVALYGLLLLGLLAVFPLARRLSKGRRT